MQESNFTEVKFFSASELNQLLLLENQQIQKVTYFNWVNKAKNDEAVEFLDKIEFTFIDKETICISVSELMDALEVIDFNIIAVNKELYDKFEGDVYIKESDVSNSDVWQNVLEYEINEVQLEMNEKHEYFSDKILLSFGPEKRLISLGQQGIVVTIPSL
ncbi:MAG: hypothetical protein IPO27_07870 [Bacteroidetes bacterium]|nr:hypothetical protein [Bacteroidota bacterium]